MPQHQPPHDHTGPPNSLATAPVKLDEKNEEVLTASAAATALRAASASPPTNPKSSLSTPSSHNKTNSLSPASRPPRTSSLLPPPRNLQQLPFEGNEPTESTETASAADRYWHQYTSDATHEEPHELNTSLDHDGPFWNAHRPKHNRPHHRAAQASHGRPENADGQGLSRPPTDSFESRGTEAGLHAHRTDQQSQPATGALASASLPPLELPPSLDRNLGESSTSVVDTPHTGSLPPEQSSRQMPQDQPRDGRPARGHGRRRSSKGSNDADKGKTAKPPSQKAMLSRALQKANTAVQLDNAQNLEGARIAYSEACDLLQQVLRRTSGDDDKRKLEAIVSKSQQHHVQDTSN